MDRNSLLSDLVYHAGQIAMHQERLNQTQEKLRLLLVPVAPDHRPKGLLTIPAGCLAKEKLTTIKIIRSVTGLGLMESKAMADNASLFGQPIPIDYAAGLWAVKMAQSYGAVDDHGAWIINGA